MTHPIHVPLNGRKNNTNSFNIGHRCESYPCYYCNPDIFFSSSPNSFNSIGCIEKKLWLQQEHISSSLSSTSSFVDNGVNNPKMVDAEVQINPDDFVIIDETEKLSKSQDATTSTSNLRNLLLSKSQYEEIKENKGMKENEDDGGNELFSSLCNNVEDKEDKHDTHINDSMTSDTGIDMVFDLEYSDDESPIQKEHKQANDKNTGYKNMNNDKFIENIDIGKLTQTEISPKNVFDYETVDGRIDSLPDSVFYDIADALMMQQSIEF